MRNLRGKKHSCYLRCKCSMFKGQIKWFCALKNLCWKRIISHWIVLRIIKGVLFCSDMRMDTVKNVWEDFIARSRERRVNLGCTLITNITTMSPKQCWSSFVNAEHVFLRGCFSAPLLCYQADWPVMWTNYSSPFCRVQFRDFLFVIRPALSEWAGEGGAREGAEEKRKCIRKRKNS